MPKKLKRIYFRGYKWTPFCKVTRFGIWHGSEYDKELLTINTED